jgi:hypothetical protein
MLHCHPFTPSLHPRLATFFFMTTHDSYFIYRLYAQPLLFPPLFGALPPPLCFVLTPDDAPPSWAGLGLLTSGLPGLTSNGSLSALSAFPSAADVRSADSGLVLLGLKAASDAAAESSDPDLEYSFERGLRESLSLESFEANRGAVVQRKRGCDTAARGARCRERRANIIVLDGYLR